MGTGGSTTPPPTGGGGSNNIVVRARGANGTENMRLTVGGTQVGAWTLGTAMQNYSVTTSATGGINVEYTNDATNRDVQVDYITVNGTTRQAENQSTNTGVYQNGACGGANSEWLNCNGYIGFGNASTTAGRLLTESVAATSSLDAAAAQVYPNPSTTGNFMVQLPAGPARVTIRNSKGRVVQQLDAVGPATIPVQLDTQPGLYYLQVTGAGESVATRLAVE
ncbi:T9SS type A sorting domain-containing protein [Hymenobacter sp. BT635]|uniref:T9SS type A sorting domain-containing protein n=2 Tax=Hymenobacter nitidus TaxID=2880929 RepID=A0ABS8AHG2_9BACT|nr:T9SS type A sorting domain-containing protein [Hymenobacter nitidus]